MKTFLIVAVLLAMSGVEAFKLRSCSENPAEDKLRVLVADVNPDPVHLPGNFTAGGTIEIVGDYNGNYSADVKVTRKFLGLFDINVPCLDTKHGVSVGSCHYDDLCGIIDMLVNSTECPAYFNNTDFPCHCPFSEGIFKLPPYDFEVASLPPLFAAIVDGKYKIEIRLRDDDNDEELACFKMELILGRAHYHNQTEILESPVVSGQDPIIG